MRDIKTGSASYIILTVLEKTVDGFIKLQDFRQHSGSYLYGDGRNLPQSALSQALKRLKEGGLIEEVKIDNDLLIKLTNSGRNMLGNEEIEEKWNGKWCIVSFDIPEQKRMIRNIFRRNLKKWGFEHLHKSVWISKKNVYQKLEAYINELGIKKWVTIIEADRVSNINH